MGKLPVLLSFLIPFIYLFGGFLSVSATPPFGSKGLAYRTKRAAVSETTWEYAHYSFGIVCIFMGIYLAVVTGLTNVILWRVGASSVLLWIVCLIMMVIQLLLVLLPFYNTEQHLKDDFDEQGAYRYPVRKIFFKHRKKDEEWGTWIQWKDDEEWDDWDTWLQKRDLELDREREERKKKQ